MPARVSTNANDGTPESDPTNVTVVQHTGVGENPHRIADWVILSNDTIVIQAVEKTGTRLRAKKDRNMVVYRENSQLHLINPVHLDDEGMERLDSFGSVTTLIRLSTSVDQDDVDKFYLERYPSALRWAPGSDEDPLLPVHHTITEDSFLDKRSRFFVFRDLNHGEAAMVLERNAEVGFRKVSSPILITAECMISTIGNFSVTPTTNIPRQWRRSTIKRTGWWRRNPEKDNLRDEFERLLKLEFSRHVGASGTIVERHGKELAVLAVERAFYKQL